MPFNLTDLELDEISLVDEPANQQAKVVLFKRNNPIEVNDLVKCSTGSSSFEGVVQSIVAAKAGGKASAQVAVVKDGKITKTIRNVLLSSMAVSMDTETRKRYKSFITKGKSTQEALDAMKRDNREGAGPFPGERGRREQSMPNTEERLTEMEGQIENLMASVKTMQEALEAEGYTAKLDKKSGKVELAKRSDDDFVDVGGEKVLKSSVPAPILKQIEVQSKEVADLRKRAEAEDLRKRADADLPDLAAPADVRGAILKAVDGIADEETRKAAHAALKGASAAVRKGLLSERGSTAATDSDVMAELNTLAEEYASTHGVSFETAFAEVTKSGKGKELFAKRNVQ